ncbi:MAG: hypothetical protein F4X77_02935 [Acidobacteriia bacterium]|nr:hypothetical protein [Terriglobia bacterium]MYC64994.1 hypothetical protein [Terriglobia bacterium]
MTRLEQALVASFAVGITLAAASCTVETRPALRAGAAAVDITPRDWPLPMIGSFRYRPATGAHDPLHSRALVLDDGTETVAIAIVDSCYVPRETLDEAKRLAQAKTGIPADRVLIAATHTHSAPPPAPGVGLRGPEPEQDTQNEQRYSRQLIDGIAASIASAFERLEAAEIGWTRTELPDEVFNRRWLMKDGTIPPDPFGGTTDRVRMNPPAASPDLVRPSGPVDPEAVVLSIRTAAKKPLAVLANYSLHYVGNIPGGLVSADYFGEFSLAIARRLDAGDRFVGMLSNGTSGNINNIDFSKTRSRQEPFEQVRKVAGKLADAVAKAHEEIEYRPDPNLAMEQVELALARRKPTDPIVEQSRAILQGVLPSELTRRHIYAQRAIDLHNGPESVSVVLQAIRIGDVGIAALPFETFVETGLAIKRESPLQATFVISLANGAEGYLPTPEHHALGGYETWLGTSRVEEQASEKIQEQLLSSLRNVAMDGN